MLQAGLGHALADAALLDEVLFQAAALLVEQVIGLVDQADGEVCQNLGRASLHEGPVGLVGLTGRATEFANKKGFLAVLVPKGVVADAEVVLVVKQEFLQAGPRDIDELDLGFGGGDRGLAALGDVLFP